MINKYKYFFLIILYFVGLGFVFPYLTTKYPSKIYEFYFFIFLFIAINIIWYFILKKNGKDIAIKIVLDNDRTIQKISKKYFLWSFFAFLLLYFASAVYGVFASYFTVDLFAVYKEFGMHLDALSRFKNMEYPWINFAYPYGFYPIYVSSIIFSIFASADSLVITFILLNTAAVMIFLYSVQKFSNKKQFFIAFLFLIAVFLPSFFHSFYGGLQANWLRYIYPLLVIVLFPKAKDIKFILLWGVATGLVFFIAPELLLFFFVTVIVAIVYLYKKYDIKTAIYFLIGILVSVIPFLYYVIKAESVTSILQIFNNIFYQAKFILSSSELSVSIPNIFVVTRDLLSNFTIANIQTFIFSMIFYLPLFISSLLFGLWVYLEKGKIKRYQLLLFIASILSIYLKALGAVSLGYALLSIPIIIVAIVFVASIYQASRIENIFIMSLVMLMILPSVYFFQQKYFPCIFSSDNYACLFLKTRKNLSKTTLDLSSSGNIQRYTQSDQKKFMSIVRFLGNFSPDRILNFSDLTVLNYYFPLTWRTNTMIPSLYPNEIFIDVELQNIDVIIIPEEGFNFIPLKLSDKAPQVQEKIDKDYYYHAKCGPLMFFLSKGIDSKYITNQLNCD